VQHPPMQPATGRWPPFSACGGRQVQRMPNWLRHGGSMVISPKWFIAWPARHSSGHHDLPHAAGNARDGSDRPVGQLLDCADLLGDFLGSLGGLNGE